MKRALLRMGLTLFAFVLFVLGPLALSIFFLGNVWHISPNDGKTLVEILNSLAGLFLLIAELCAIVIGIVVLHSYFRYRRPYTFVFEGFSNAAKLAETAQEPIDINSLAQEELEHQFRVIYRQLREYIGETKNSSSLEDYKGLPISNSNKSANNISLLLTEYQDFEEYSRLSEIGWHLPSKEILSRKTAESVVNVLEDTMNSFKGPGISNLMNSVEESAPKEVAPIMRFIDALIPAPVIKVICHLQWRDAEVGITFEIVDFTKSRQQVLKNQTLWWKKPPSCNTQQSSKSAPSPDVERTLTADYIKLLGPAMRWLVLLSWESYTRRIFIRPHRISLGSYRKIMHTRINRRESYLSALLHILGALYYASANHFPICDNFFQQCAFNCLCWAEEDKFPGLSLPYLYLADRYVYKANARKPGRPNRYQLLLKALDSV